MINDNCDGNRKRMEEMYACMLAGDLDGFMAGIDGDVVTHQSPALPYGGVYRGKETLRTLLSETILQLIDATGIKMIAPLMAADERVIGSFTVTAKRTGTELRLLEQAVFKNGRVVELRVFYFDPTAM